MNVSARSKYSRYATLAFILVIGTGLSACVTSGGPTYSTAQLGAVSQEREINASLARQHKITYVEAARRDIATETRIAGARLTDSDRLQQSLRLALAAEVDAGRMTPELANYKLQERIAQDRANQQAADEARQEAFANKLLAVSEQLKAASAPPPSPAPFLPPPPHPITCTSFAMGAMTNTTCH